MDDSEPLQRALAHKLVQNLESLYRSGVRTIPRPVLVSTPPATTSNRTVPTPHSPSPRPSASVATAVPPPAPTVVSSPPQPFSASKAFGTPVLPADQRLPALQVLAEEVAACSLCTELAQKRTQTVFGVGNPNARLVFFGEAPGADEDRQGEPFVGKAGQLLTKIIEACKLRREDVYIMNVLKCRPPGNRNPTPEEAARCRPFFEKQLEIIRPEVICCLGSIAATTLLETTQSVGRLRGKFHQWRGISVAVTYHPAYLLRTPAAKKTTWADMKMVMRQLGVEL